MSRVLRYLSVLLILTLLATGLGCGNLFSTDSNSLRKPSAPPPDFRFAVFGDNRPENPMEPQPEIFKKLIAQIELERPALVFSTGDMVTGKTANENIYRRQYRDFLEIIQKLKTFHAAVGNHDAANQIGQSLYQEYLSERLYYSFDYKGSHFIILNTEIVGQAGRIGELQLSWLKEDLESNNGAFHIFVFMHRPLYSIMNPQSKRGRHMPFTDIRNRDQIRELMRKYRVDVVFAGHEHFFNKQVHDGITYIITGCAGAFPYTDEGHGGFRHYVLVEVKGRHIHLTVVKATGERINPDRIPTPSFQPFTKIPSRVTSGTSGRSGHLVLSR
ncbi:MAG: metallophosphoesterase [Actinomycetota bacterium]